MIYLILCTLIAITSIFSLFGWLYVSINNYQRRIDKGETE